MSGCFRRRSRGDSNGDNDDVDEEEDKGSQITATKRGKRQKKSKSKRVFSGYTNGVPKKKKAVLFPFGELRKFFRRSLSSSSSASSGSHNLKNSSLVSGKRRFGGRLGSCVCFSKPQVLEDNPSQGSGDPDDPEEFSYENLKSMIEKNDFYSKECDTHFVD